jgi:hypothetical protein
MMVQLTAHNEQTLTPGLYPSGKGLLVVRVGDQLPATSYGSLRILPASYGPFLSAVGR